MDDPLKPRPYRVREVLWDQIPLVIGAFIYFFVLAPFANKAQEPGMPEFFTSVLIPVLAAMWMQFSCTTTATEICRREFREQLAMTHLESRPYLVAVFRARLVGMLVPFLASPFFMAMLFLIVAPDSEETPFSLSVALLVIGFFGAYASWLVCGYAIGLWGLSTRLRRLCDPRPSDFASILTAGHFCVIIFLGSLLSFAGLGFVIAATENDFSEADQYYYFGLYLTSVGFLAAWFFLRAAHRSWRIAQRDFFRFE